MSGPAYSDHATLASTEAFPNAGCQPGGFGLAVVQERKSMAADRKGCAQGTPMSPPTEFLPGATTHPLPRPG